MAPRGVDAVAIPHDQIDALRDGDGQVDADAGEGAPRQLMALDVVDLRDVGQELEMDEVLAGPDREAVGEVHQPEASREDFLDIEAVQQ